MGYIGTFPPNTTAVMGIPIGKLNDLNVRVSKLEHNGLPGSITITDGTTTLTGITEINFTSGATISSGGAGIVNVAIAGGGSGFQQPLTGALNQSTFTWATAPNVIVIDGAPRQKVQSDGTFMWTGTTTTVLTNAPQPTFDIFSTA